MNHCHYCGMRSRMTPMSSAARATTPVPVADDPCYPCDELMVVAHVRPQTWNETYGTEDAFVAGTLFPELNKPLGGGCRRG